jgi:predicted XRE-type DNA-binding protein
MSRAVRQESITRGSGDVFADLGFADAPERNLRLRLAVLLNQILTDSESSRGDIAKRLGVPQSKVSALVNTKLDLFSAEKLMEFFTALNHDIEIMVRPRAGLSAPGAISVSRIQ